MLVGRVPELAAVAATLDAARAGRAGRLVLVGERGIGKTSLLDAAAAAADGFRLLRSGGAEAELGLGHAVLLELLGPLRDDLAALPAPQQQALATALGWAPGPVAGDRFLVAAATMSLVARAAEREPVLGGVDDLKGVDRHSAGAVAFVARPLRFDRVTFLLARRPGDDDEFADLPSCPVPGL